MRMVNCSIQKVLFMMKQIIVDCLGPEMKTTPEVVHRTVIVYDQYTLEHLLLRLNQEELVPAYFAYPHGLKPVPIVLFNHSHGGDFTAGKTELISGADYLQSPSFLETLIADGYAVGCIDMWGFGERSQGESQLFKRFLLQGKTLWGQRVYDNQQFLTYLLSRQEINKEAVATTGMSMDGLMSWWLAASDPRITAVVDIAAQVDYQALIEEDCLDKHGCYYYLPAFLTKWRTADIQQLIAPRPRLSLVGIADKGCPASGVKKLDHSLKEIYIQMGQPAHWQSLQLSGGHEETKEMRGLWRSFLKQQLGH